jgi:formylglycine-generating enzyme required for sulfatase activity
MRKTVKMVIAVLMVLVLAFPAAGRQEKTGMVFRDGFRDGSGRNGPEMVAIEATAFTMGSRPEEPGYKIIEVPHRVMLSAYAIGKYEVTNREFCQFLDEMGNRSADNLPYVLIESVENSALCREGDTFRPTPGREALPVVRVSWRGALAYTEWLSRKTGFFYTLPTEAQWENAARAGTTTTWPWGDTFQPGKLNTTSRLLPVGQYPPNAFGIHDMLGNVWEWVLDCFEPDFYFYAPSGDPVLLDRECLVPGIRGGSFRDDPGMCRPGFRINLWWRGDYDGVGFRVVRLFKDLKGE